MAAQAKTGRKLRGGQQAGEPAESTPFSTPPVTTRPDFHGFYDLEELPRMGGAAPHDLAKYVAKELGDNALDASGALERGRLDGNGFFIQNPTDMPFDAERLAAILSVNRPLTSTKSFRIPSRGGLGNGWRVLVGAVYASCGRLVVHTGGWKYEVTPRDDGTTTVKTVGPAEPGLTRFEVMFGPAVRVGSDVFEWVDLATLLATRREYPTDRPSIHWHTPNSFFRLLQDTAEMTVRQMVERFDGLAGPRASKVCGGLSGPTQSVSREDVTSLFGRMRAETEPPTHNDLGRIGDLAEWGGRPKREDGWIKGGGVNLPVRVEAWAVPANRFTITFCVNGTPVPTKFTLRDTTTKRENKTVPTLALAGPGGVNYPVGGSTRRKVAVLVNIMCPKMPVLDNGKSPDLNPVWEPVRVAVGGAITKVRTAPAAAAGGQTQKDVILANLKEAVRVLSDNGRLEFNLRNLFYTIRPRLIDLLGREPNYGTFSEIIGEYEDEVNEHGVRHDIPGLYRDNRGILYEPHTGKEMPLGTRSARTYVRPTFLFNKILYCEKEGFFPQLIVDGWPERHDCALVTGKGFAPRAVAELLKVMGDTGEPLTIYCIHDADGSGTSIYHALQEGARRRTKRNIEVIDLGLNPAEALAMKLPVEPVDRGKDKVAYGDHMIGEEWPESLLRSRPELRGTTPEEWLQKNRVELNAIVPVANFIAWLDSKMVGQPRKVIPPPAVVAGRLRSAARKEIEDRKRDRILRENDLDGCVNAAMAAIEPALEDRTIELNGELSRKVDKQIQSHWTNVVDDEAADLVDVEFKPQTARSPAR